MTTSKTADADLAVLLQGLLGPTPAPRMWSVSYDGPGVRVFTNAFSAAKFITAEARRLVKSGCPGMLTVTRLDTTMLVEADASGAVLEALVDSGWIAHAADPSYAIAYRLRDQVNDTVETVLLGLN